ncbi:MAG: BTAD domain-containing putative transcriptional regulator [Acidimicrobiales bacterium]
MDGQGLAIDLLGAFRVRRAGAQLWPRLSLRCQALVAFVVLKGEVADRSQLAGTLWPMSTEGQARTNLRKAMHELRYEAPDLYDSLTLGGTGLGWQTGNGTTVDVAEFRSLAAMPVLGSLQQAAALYRGPLLPALSDIWLVEEREALQLEHQRVLRSLVDLHRSRGELREALEHAATLTRADPLADDAHVRLFELAALLGERGLTELAWQRHQRSLDELGLKPSPTVAEAYEKARFAQRARPELLRLKTAPPEHRGEQRAHNLSGSSDGPRLFGRDEHLGQLLEWLGTPTTKALVLTGVPGVGKSALLGAFCRELAHQGRPFAVVDGHRSAAAPASIWQALGASDHTGALEWAERNHAVLVLDNFDDIGPLGQYLADDFLPQLGKRARVVVATRSLYRHTSTWGSYGRGFLRELELPSLEKDAALEYLASRGVTDSNVAARLVGRAGLTPLALSLAADLVTELAPGSAWSSRHWHYLNTRLLEEWLHDVPNDSLRELVSSASVVREVDQDMLGALAGRPVTRDEMTSLARLPGTRMTEGGLRINDDFRRLLAEDLNWRAPDRARQLRLRALEEYQARLPNATPRRREHLAAELLFLSQDALLQDLLFCPEEQGQVYSEQGRPQQVDELERVLHSWGDQRMDLPRPRRMVAATRAIFSYRGTLLRLVRREGDGTIVALAAVVPVCQESARLLLDHPGIEPYARARWPQIAALPALPENSRLFHFTHAAYREDLGSASRAARARLLREIVGLLARQGTYSFSTPDPQYHALAEALGFRRVTEVRHALYGRHHMCEHYELDLSDGGFAGWVNGLLRPVTPA